MFTPEQTAAIKAAIAKATGKPQVSQVRTQLDQLRAAWAASTDPATRNYLMNAMTSIATSASTPNNVNGNLSPDQMLDWLAQRKGVTDQLAGMTMAEKMQEIQNEQAKEAIGRNALTGKTKTARSVASRGIANSSIREVALMDIDKNAEIARNDIDDRLETLRGQNDIARSNAINYWGQYDEALDAQRLINASANAPATEEIPAVPAPLPANKQWTPWNGVDSPGEAAYRAYRNNWKHPQNNAVKPKKAITPKGAGIAPKGTPGLTKPKAPKKPITPKGGGISNAQAKKIAQNNAKKGKK